VQERLREIGLADDRARLTASGKAVLMRRADDEQLRLEVGSEEFDKLLLNFRAVFAAFKKSESDHLFFQYGLGPGATWKAHQLISYMFLHGGLLHLAGNCIFFLALATSVERLWGQGVFAAFYILVGVMACLPSLMLPTQGPMIGASGAISGMMGAFLVCFINAKVKVGWLSLPLFLILPFFRRKPFGIVRIPAYIFLAYYFVSQISFWWVSKKADGNTGVAYSAHVAGFFFGVFFAVMLELVRLKKDFAPPTEPVEPDPAVSLEQANDLLKQGDVGRAAYKLRYHLSKYPEDTTALNTLIDIYRRTSSHEQLSEVYAKVIRHNLSKGDRDAALHNFIQLQTALVGSNFNPLLGVRDWMVICDQMYRTRMVREAIYECRRLAEAYTDDPLAVRALVMAGEVALWISDRKTALDSFEKAMSMNPPPALEARARQGLESCNAGAIRQEYFSNDQTDREMEFTTK
jgi:membrane associated rhomboid family serine protease